MKKIKLERKNLYTLVKERSITLTSNVWCNLSNSNTLIE